VQYSIPHPEAFQNDQAACVSQWGHTATKQSKTRRKLHYTAPACAFCVGNFFQFLISTNQPARPRRVWGSARKTKLKRLKRISVNFSFPDLRRIEGKLQSYEFKGFYLIFFSLVDR
jgi:hypothetical protein